MAIINLEGNFTEHFTSPESCGTETFSAQINTVIELVNKFGDRWSVKVYRAYEGDNQIEKKIGKTYCISEDDLNRFFIDFTKLDYGILTVPFKVRFDPFKIFPGGTIGGFVGRKFVRQRSTSTLLGFAGLSSIPLNNINSDVIDTQLGITGGAGYVWYVLEGFQVGFIAGIDLFDGVNSWPYKYQPWASFNIGYAFTSQSREKNQKLNSALLSQ